MGRVGVLLAMVCCMRFAYAADAPPPQVTQVLGQPPPAFAGRWLLVPAVALAEKSQSSIVLWEVADEGGRPRVTLRQVQPPASVQGHLDAANAAGGAWTPSPDDLHALATAWDGLAPASSPAVEAITTDLATPAGYDDALRAEPELQDAAWLVRQTKKFRPGSGPAIEETQVFAVQTSDAGGFGGIFRSVTLAKVMVVIPIRLGGTFRAFRVDDPNARGWFARLADQLVGCGRR